MIDLNLKSKVVAFDTECTGLIPWGNRKRWGFYPARPFAFSFCDTEGNTAYVRWKVNPKTRQVIPDQKSFKKIQKILGDPYLTKIGHNIAYDLRMVTCSGFKLRGKIEDTLIMAHTVTGGSEFTYALKPLANKYLDISNEDEKQLQEATVKARNRGKKLGWSLAVKEFMGREPIKADYWMAPPEICEKYARLDAERTMLFYLLWHDETRKDPNMLRVYAREMKLFYVIRKMENRGARVLPKELAKLRKFYEDYMEQQVKLADRSGGKGLNYRSHKQMTNKFYLEKKYPPKYNEKGNYKLDGEKLAELAEKDKLAKAILEYRGAGHMLSAFLNPYDRFRIEEDKNVWVLRPNYRQVGTITGRLSCGDPNLMQVASETTGRRKTEITLRPREAFAPRKGYIWYLPDYSQIEVWVFSFLAQEQAMIKALLSGHDFHGTISERVWGKEKDFKERKSYYRKRAKLLMFCKLYGGGAKKIAYLQECSIKEAEKFIFDYDKELPGVKKFMKRMINRSIREGKLVNPFGRTYFIHEKYAYRAVNYLVQGSSADIMKQAMINVDELFTKKWKGCHLLLTLHDELICEIPLKSHSKKLMRDIVEAMQGDFHKRINSPKPLPISMKIASKTWSSTTEIKL